MLICQDASNTILTVDITLVNATVTVNMCMYGNTTAKMCIYMSSDHGPSIQ